MVFQAVLIVKHFPQCLNCVPNSYLRYSSLWSYHRHFILLSRRSSTSLWNYLNLSIIHTRVSSSKYTSIYSNHLWCKNITISTACLCTHWTAYFKMYYFQQVAFLFHFTENEAFSHLAHVVWFACLKWFKIKWVQMVYLHGVSPCIYTNSHGSHVSNFSKTSESKDPSTWSFFMRFTPIWLTWQCHK